MCDTKRLVYERDDNGFYDEPVFDDDYTDDECVDDLCALGWSAADARDFINGGV
jgi:hypothetical protein